MTLFAPMHIVPFWLVERHLFHCNIEQQWETKKNHTGISTTINTRHPPVVLRPAVIVCATFWNPKQYGTDANDGSELGQKKAKQTNDIGRIWGIDGVCVCVWLTAGMLCIQASFTKHKTNRQTNKQIVDCFTGWILVPKLEWTATSRYCWSNGETQTWPLPDTLLSTSDGWCLTVYNINAGNYACTQSMLWC